MRPTMNFVAEVSDTIVEASAPLDITNVIRTTAEALEKLPRCPVSTSTVRFVDEELDFLAEPFGKYYVGYSIRDEVVKLLVVKEISLP